MALSITHTTVATLPDEAGAEVNKAEWNAAHAVAGLGTGVETALAVDVGSGGALVTFGGALGTPASGVATNLTGTAAGLTAGNATLAATVTTNANLTGIVTSTGNATAIADKAISYTKLADGTDGNLITWDAAGVAALVATGTATHVLTSNGAGTAPTFQVLPAASSTWDTIGAAAADKTTANGDWNIVYQVAKVVDAEISWRFTESAAATNGTSTSGVPNQVLVRLDTIAASTMSPLSVYSRAAHVFSVSPTTAQILATSGTGALPAYSFAADADTGMYFVSSNVLGFAAAGGLKVSITTTSLNSAVRLLLPTSEGAAAPQMADNVAGTTGIGFPSSSTLDLVIGGVQNTFWDAGLTQPSKGTADAVAYAINARKSRGSVASPTVITTGDDLLKLSGFGYVGATGTYVEACRITYDSTGVIANTTSGVGGIIRFGHAIVGTVGATEVAMFRSQHLIHEGSSPTITAGGGGAGVGIVGKDEAFEVTIGAGGVATSVEVTFANAFTTNPPVCVAASDTDIVPFKCVVTVTKVTISATLAFTAGSILHVICRGWE